MFARTRLALVGLAALIQPCLPVAAENVGPRPANASAAEAVFVGVNFKQETITATCTKFTSSGTFWTCSGTSTKIRGSKALIVENVACRASASGGLAHTQVDIRRGTGVTYDWTDFLTPPMTTTFALGGLVYQATTVTVVYVVPVGQRLLVEGALTGSAMSSANLHCTVTGRFMTP